MAGLSMFMSVVGEMGTSLSIEDKNILMALQQVQGRLAAVQTSVVDTEDEDHNMGSGPEAGAKSLRSEGTEAPADNQKRQKQKASSESKTAAAAAAAAAALAADQKKEASEPKPNEAGTGSGSNVVATKPSA